MGRAVLFGEVLKDQIDGGVVDEARRDVSNDFARGHRQVSAGPLSHRDQRVGLFDVNDQHVIDGSIVEAVCPHQRLAHRVKVSLLEAGFAHGRAQHARHGGLERRRHADESAELGPRHLGREGLPDPPREREQEIMKFEAMLTQRDDASLGAPRRNGKAVGESAVLHRSQDFDRRDRAVG